MKKYLILLLSLGLIFTFCACSNTNDNKNETTTTRLITYSQNNIASALAEFSQEKDKIHQDLEKETDLDAEATKSDIDQLKKNVEGFDHELDQAVESNKLTKEAKQSYDQTIEELKTDIDTLNAKLKEK